MGKVRNVTVQTITPRQRRAGNWTAATTSCQHERAQTATKQDKGCGGGMWISTTPAPGNHHPYKLSLLCSSKEAEDTRCYYSLQTHTIQITME